MSEPEASTAASGELERALRQASSLSELLDLSAAAHASRPALLDGEVAFSYAEFATKVRSMAYALQQLGVRADDRIAIALPNCWEYAVTYFAIQAAGAVAVLVNIRFTEGEISHVLADSGSVVVVTDPEFEVKIVTDAAVVLANALTGAPHAPEDWRPVPREPGDAANLLYTSGTTGKPKGAVQTQGNLVYNAALNRELFEHTSEDRTLIAAPFFHATGLNSQLIGMISAGGLCVLQPSFKTAESLRLLADHKITFFAGVATMLQLLIRHPAFPDSDLSHLRLFVLGGAPVPEAALDLAAEHLPTTVLGNVWGLTEATSIVTYVRGEDFRAHPRSVGRAVDGVEVGLWDEFKGAFVSESGVIGELCVRGPVVTAGYWQNQEATEKTFRDGWLHTGDLGSIDGDHYVQVLDRSKDMIIRGGENVYSLEVENAIAAHPDVALVAVFGRPDELFGERVCAAVVPEAGSQPTPESLRAWAAERLADYKVPVEWHLLDEMPLNASGKILKRQLSESIEAG